ncbi:MAG: prepilin-type N-terminal cleavage/methylation domain-containing protein [Acidobacteria bacterium]|nr:prepilin-type N-terminal cleavage/methylation domain-containing protein [Acidobacteriota bacterium]MDA1236249.1 prepilin-type N-terminal cleavage/methylation domain-containing protein [Acidobacteriota bacterium]
MHRSSQSGFSLLEMMVATALTGLTVVGLLSLTSQSLSNSARIREYDRAAMLARAQMDELLTVDPPRLNQPLEGAFDPLSGWEARITPVEVDYNAGAAGGTLLARVDLTIWWQRDGRRKTFPLEAYRRVRIDPSSAPGNLDQRTLQ